MTRRSARRAGIAAVGLGLAGAWLAFHRLGLAGSTPFGVDGAGRLTTAVWIDGQGPFDFLLDTGSEISCLSPAMVARVRPWHVPGLGARVQGTGSNAHSTFVLARTFTSPVFRRLFELLVVIPNADAARDGVLGANAFAGKRLELDFETHRLSLSESEPPPAGFVATPLEVVPTLKMMARAQIDGVPVRAILDTGTRRSLGNLELARALSMDEGDPRLVPSNGVIGATKAETPAWDSELGELAIAGQRFAHPRVTFSDLPWFDAMGFHGIPVVILGVDQLSRLRALAIDYPRMELQIKTASP